MDPLFPELPEDLASLSDEELSDLLQKHQVAVDLIDAEDEDFTKGLSAEDVISQYTAGVEQIEAIVADQKRRSDEEEQYLVEKAELSAKAKAALKVEAAEETEESDQLALQEEQEEVEEGAEADGEEEEVSEEEPVSEVEVVTAAAETESKEEERKPAPVRLRRPPQASPERQLRDMQGTQLIAASQVEGARPGQAFDRMGLAKAMHKTANRFGRVSKHDRGTEHRILIASASYAFPEERKLHPKDWEANSEKLAAVVPPSIPGLPGYSNDALVASGGLCAPLEPIYSMPNFASQARPVRDGLPSFQAERGGVNVPTATAIGDITTAISIIEEAEDALGGTFATKSCQDLDCPAYTEVPVTIISHCREYGNLNAMAWPEKIAHENDLTMAAHARSAESYLLGRIRAQSVVETSAQVLGAYADLADVLLRVRASVSYVLRMAPGARFRVLAPAWLGELLADDSAQAQFDRYQNQAQMVAHLEALGFAVTLFQDDIGVPAVGVSQAFGDEVSGGAADGFPTVAQVAVYPEGEFIHVDSGSLELGIVRDSTLNSTNDYQIFGETFENVARLGPEQGARWIEATVCPTGEFATPGAARTCSE
jgi:hypothetical protein